MLGAFTLYRDGEWQLTPLKYTFLLWLGVAVVSLLGGNELAGAFREVKKEVLYFILTFWLFYTMTKNRKDFTILSCFILASTTLLIIVSLYCSYVLGYEMEEMSIRGIPFSNRAYFCFLMLSTGILCLVLCMLDDTHKALKIYCALLLPLCILAVYIARLRAGYLSIALVVCTLIGLKIIVVHSYKVKAALVLLILAILLFALIVFVDINLNWEFSVDTLKRYTEEQRWVIWRHFIVNSIMENPILGAGFGNKHSVVEALNGRSSYPHNLFLSYGVMMGLPGMIVLGMLFTRLFRLLQKGLLGLYAVAYQTYLLRLAGILILLVFFVQNLTEDVMVRHTGLFFWAIMGMILGGCRSVKPRKG
jgi:O-antigen ligase